MSHITHFLTGCELSKEELLATVKHALSIKQGKVKVPQQSGAIFTMMFANPSLRTRLSCSSGIAKMGGVGQVLSLGDAWVIESEEGAIMDAEKQEHIKEAAPVISSYSDLIGLRQCSLATRSQSSANGSSWDEYKDGDSFIHKLAKYSTVPVINLESNMYHPCQGLADLVTIEEFKGDVSNKKIVLTWAPHPKALPLATPHSQILMPSLAGMDVTLACPEGFELADEVLELCKANASNLSVTNNQAEALAGADVVIAKSWAHKGYFAGEEANYWQDFKHWQLTAEKMAQTNKAIFMHCLPIRRNVIATDELLDGENSKHVEGAENRMWAQIALMDLLLQKSGFKG